MDIATADVYLFQDGEWTLVGNITFGLGLPHPETCTTDGDVHIEG